MTKRDKTNEIILAQRILKRQIRPTINADICNTNIPTRRLEKSLGYTYLNQ
jgi:hypothetical protein